MDTHLFHQAAELPDDDRHDPHDTYCGWCDAHETAGEPHRDDCPQRAAPCRGCGSIRCDSECAEYRQWLAVAYLDWDAAHGGDADARP